jgi:hypothetical protein
VKPTYHRLYRRCEDAILGELGRLVLVPICGDMLMHICGRWRIEG